MLLVAAVPMSLGAQCQAEGGDASRNWRARVVGGFYRDGSDGIAGIRRMRQNILRDSSNAGASRLAGTARISYTRCKFDESGGHASFPERSAR